MRSRYFPIVAVIALTAGLLLSSTVLAQTVHQGEHKEDSSVSAGHMTMEKDHEKTAKGHDHAGMIMAAEKEEGDLAGMVRVEEKLGESAALDAWFTDEKGNRVAFEKIFDKPVVVLPVYFTCTSVCNFLQANLTNALNQVDQVPGRDFNVVTLSFDDEEDHTHADTSKRNYNNLITRDFPKENWFYLTGDLENIKKVTDSLGYYFLKTKKHFFIHPSALVVLAKDAKIIRYLYGPNFLPFDLGMALNEAERGEPGISIKRGVLSFCFDYDPENKTYVFKLFRITGTAILLLLVGFVAFLLIPSKRRGRGRSAR